MDDNVLDASELYPSGFHPEFQDSPRDGPCYKTCPRKSRITTPVKYYWSDFMSAARIVPKDNTEYGRGEKDDVIRAPRKMVKNWNLCGITDPFKHDVFVFGITLKYGLSQVCFLSYWCILGGLISLIAILEPRLFTLTCQNHDQQSSPFSRDQGQRTYVAGQRNSSFAAMAQKPCLDISTPCHLEAMALALRKSF